MTGRDEIGRRPGPVAALLVLFGLLLNVATAPGGQLDRDPRAARLGNSEVVRTAAGVRLASRSDDDGSSRDQVVALPPAPQPVVADARTYPSGAALSLAVVPRPLDPPAHYRARAPPAA